jgi:7-cyano-7-deazaguanine synthase
MKAEPRPAVILLSGGLDSTTLLAIARGDGFTPYTLTFDYGQRHAAELDAARGVAEAFGVERHLQLSIDLRAIGGSALTAGVDVPKERSEADMGSGIPVTYVPARNTIFLSIALGWAEVLGARDIYIGVNALDYSGYPDCRPDFIAAFEKTANLGTRTGVEGDRFRIHAPLMRMTKADIIRKGISLGVDYARTHSCYDPAPGGAACGRCDACILRRKGFREAGLEDPVPYAS